MAVLPMMMIVYYSGIIILRLWPKKGCFANDGYGDSYDGFLPYSQAKVTGPYPQPDESNPYSPTLFH
jgi:hypothetical protein